MQQLKKNPSNLLRQDFHFENFSTRGGRPNPVPKSACCAPCHVVVSHLNTISLLKDE